MDAQRRLWSWQPGPVSLGASRLNQVTPSPLESHALQGPRQLHPVPPPRMATIFALYQSPNRKGKPLKKEGASGRGRSPTLGAAGDGGRRTISLPLRLSRRRGGGHIRRAGGQAAAGRKRRRHREVESEMGAKRPPPLLPAPSPSLHPSPRRYTPPAPSHLRLSIFAAPPRLVCCTATSPLLPSPLTLPLPSNKPTHHTRLCPAPAGPLLISRPSALFMRESLEGPRVVEGECS